MKENMMRGTNRMTAKKTERKTVRQTNRQTDRQNTDELTKTAGCAWSRLGRGICFLQEDVMSLGIEVSFE